jgi:hypothetical protein
MLPSLVRGAAQWRRGRLQYRLELYRNAHRRTPFVLSLSSHSFILTHFHGKTNTNKLYEQYDVPKNLDTLHQVVTEARARRQQQQRGESDAGGGRDIWRADLQPRVAVRARTVPALEHERDLLRARLADVRISFPSPPPSLLPPVRRSRLA